MINLAVFLGLLTVVTSLQWCSGAFAGAFGFEADEPSHYVTGLMIRDYIGAGFPGNPIRFAENFYLHYPRVAFGLWPPLVHLFYGVWMFIFGDHRESVLVLLATVTAVWGYVFFRILKPRFGFSLALIGAVLLISLPSVQTSAMTVMLDIATALAILAAMVQYGRYLSTESDRDALVFGLCAALAALVKYNGLMLALLPPVCILLTGRYSLLRRRSFWLPAAVVLVLAGPWYFAMRRLVFYAAAPGDAAEGIGSVAAGNVLDLARLGGPLLFALAVAGAGLAIQDSRRQFCQVSGPGWQTNLQISAVGILGCTWLFHTVFYPIQGERYQLPAAACLILLALLALAAAVTALRVRAPLFRLRVEVAAMAMLVLPFAAFTFHVPQKNTKDFVAVAERILSQSLPPDSVILIGSDAKGEGMFVSEIAMRAPRPRYFVARSTKFLAVQTLMGQEYRSLFSNGLDLMNALDRVPVSMAVLDESVLQKTGKDGQLLASLPTDYPKRFELLHTIAKESGGHIRAYKLIGNQGKPFNRMSIDMHYTLGHSVDTVPNVDRRIPNEP